MFSPELRVTAFQMLHRYSKVKKGEKILVHGASGGVGTALLQLGNAAEIWKCSAQPHFPNSH